MRLELANSQIMDISDINLIYSEIDKLDKKNDHLILSDGDNFIQLAFLGHNLYETEYSDASGYFRTTNVDLDLSVIKQLFEGFFNGSSDWKNLTQWTLEAEVETAGSSSNYGNTGSTGRSSGNFKEDIAEQLKRDALNWGKRKLKRFLKF